MNINKWYIMKWYMYGGFYSVSNARGETRYYIAYIRQGRYRGRLVMTRVVVRSGAKRQSRGWVYETEVNDKQYKVRVGCGKFITVNGVSKWERKIKLKDLRDANLSRIAEMYGLTMHELTSMIY